MQPRVTPTTAPSRAARRALAAVAVVVGLALLGLRARFGFEPTDAPPRVFAVSLWGLPLGSWQQGELIAALAPRLALARAVWLVLAGLLGLLLARAVAPLVPAGRRARFGTWLGAAAVVFFAADPALLDFVARRSFAGAPHYLEVGDALRGLGVSALAVAAFALVAPRAGAAPPPAADERPDARRTALGLVAAGLVAAGASAAWSLLFLGGEPLTNDGQAYRFQAALFARGVASLPGGPWSDFFSARQVYFGDAVFAKYPPGHAWTLTVGTWLGSPLLLVRLAWFAGPAGVWFLARRLGVARPLTAAWLYALSPTPLVLGGLWLSHGTSLPAALAFLACAVAALDADDRGDARRARVWSLGAGLALGLCAAARPGTGVALALPLVVATLARPRRLASCALPAALGALPAALGVLAFDRATTGDPWLTPYVLYAREFSPEDRWGLVNAPLAAGHTALGAARLDLWLHGFGGSAGLALLGLACLRRRRWLVVAAPLALAAFYALLRFQGLPWAGPLYWVEAWPLLACASAAALERVAGVFGAGARRVLLGAAVLGAALLGVEHGRAARAEASLRRAPAEAARREGVERGVVFVRLDDEPSIKRHFLAPPPGFVLEGDVPPLLFVVDRGARNADLVRALGEPPAFDFDPRTGRLEPR